MLMDVDVPSFVVVFHTSEEYVNMWCGFSHSDKKALNYGGIFYAAINEYQTTMHFFIQR